MAVFSLTLVDSSGIAVLVSIIARFEWPYLVGLAILAIGMPVAIRAQKIDDGADKLVQFGPVLFAIAMAVFGADHLIAPRAVATVVPSYMPWHLFWTYLVGLALIAGAISLASGKLARLAAGCLGIMIFLFVLMIHVPGCFKTHFSKTFVTLFFRDLSLSSGAIAFAAAGVNDSKNGTARAIIAAMRIAFAATLVVFGIDHFLYPTFAPGIPQDDSSISFAIPAWIPAHALWAYLTGTIFIVCGLAIATGKQMRLAAIVVATTVLVFVALVYLPTTIARFSDIDKGLNYLAIHFALAGAALFLASALPKHVTERVSMAVTQG